MEIPYENMKGPFTGIRINLYQPGIIALAAEFELSDLEKLRWGTVELQFNSCQNPSIFDDILSHSLSVLYHKS